MRKDDAARTAEIRRADQIYYPCAFGVHVCGSNDEKNEAITIANIPARSEADARKVFEACKAEAEAAPGEPQDFVVDLNVGEDHRHKAWYCARFTRSRTCAGACRAMPS